MADTATPVPDGGGLGPAYGVSLGSLVFIQASVQVGATYATGGNPIQMPPGSEGMDFLAVYIANDDDGTRVWSYNGDPAAPKFTAADAFSTEEANATDVSGTTLDCLFVFRQ